MRRYSIISIAALLLTACSSSYELDHALVPQPHDWLQYGGDAGRSNFVREPSEARRAAYFPAPTDSAEIIWEYSLDGPAGEAAPLLLQETVLFFSKTGWGEAVDLASGDKVGAFPCQWYIHATPAIAAGCLFVATNGNSPLLLCFDLKDRIIRYRTGIPSVQASLCAVGQRVILAARNGEVRSYAERDTVPLWRTALHDLITAAPAANDSVVVVAGQNGDLNGLSVSDGRKLWRISTGSAFVAGPTVNGQFAVAANLAGVITMIDASSGEIRWQVELGEPVYQGIAWKDNALAIPLSGGDLVILHPEDGKELARISTGELPGAAPIFYANHILLLQRRGVLVGIDPVSGSVTEIARMDSRSETAPLVTPAGIVLVDEEGEAVMVGWEKGNEGNEGNVGNGGRMGMKK
ncbi:MAG: PQQ-binding-like beta-propeller repeat protein [Bacteroidota bacterium]